MHVKCRVYQGLPESEEVIEKYAVGARRHFTEILIPEEEYEAYRAKRGNLFKDPVEFVEDPTPKKVAPEASKEPSPAKEAPTSKKAPAKRKSSKKSSKSA